MTNVAGFGAIALRPEHADDLQTIHALTKAAFAGRAYASGTEPAIIDALRRDGDLTLSLVAEDAEQIVGHIAFSPVRIADGTSRWFGLGPVSVWPELQSQGIGSALIRRGIADLRAMGASGIVLLGNPDYYGRFGFEHDPALMYPGPPAPYFQRLVLTGDAPTGEVRYAPGFSVS